MRQTYTHLFQSAAWGHCQRPRVGCVVMGTWSTRLWGNDSALDALDEVACGEFSIADLAEELQADYIDVGAGAAALTPIEVALAVRGQREFPRDSEGKLTVDPVGALVDDERADWLLSQVDRVLSPGSEVYETWRETRDETFHEWLRNANAAVSDLQRELGSGPFRAQLRRRIEVDRGELVQALSEEGRDRRRGH